jgi:hypothetical protein
MGVEEKGCTDCIYGRVTKRKRKSISIKIGTIRLNRAK